MTSLGHVRVWHDEKGWGVLDSDVTPGGCWAHFSSVLIAGYRTLLPGQEVRFTFETAEQDGYSFRAVEVWPSDQEPDQTGHVTCGPSAAFGSTLTLSLDAEEGSDN